MKILSAIFGTALILFVLIRITGPADTTEPVTANEVPAEATAAVASEPAKQIHKGIELDEPVSRQSTSSIIDLVLFGTLVSDDARLSFAMIAEPGSNSALNYREGDTLPDGSTLLRIAERFVEISNDGGTQLLEIPHDSSMSTRQRSAVTASLASAHEAEAAAFGLWDGEAGMTESTDTPARPSAEVYRTRSGPTLTPEQRSAAEKLALDN